MKLTPAFTQTVRIHWICQPKIRKQLALNLPEALAPEPDATTFSSRQLLQQQTPVLLIVEENQAEMQLKEALKLKVLYPSYLSLVLLTEYAPSLAQKSHWVQHGFEDVVHYADAELLSWTIQRELQRLQKKLVAKPKGNSYLTSLLHITPVGIFHCNAKKEGVYANPRFLEITGLSLEEALGNGWMQAIHPDDREKILEQWYKSIGKPEISKGIYRYKRPKTGTVSWVLGQTISEQDADGNVIGYLGTLTDITRFKESQENLQARNNLLEKLNAELDNFVYSASHNLRSPLTTLLGLINLLRLDAGKEAQVLQVASLMEKSINRLDAFVHEIVDYSQNNRLEIQIKPISFARLLRDIEEEFTTLYDLSKVRFHIEHHIKAPINSDENRLAIILRNLLSNCIRFRNPLVKKTDIYICIHSRKEYYELTIEDNGTGIPAEHQPYVFNMFYRADALRSGAGLGLYITRDAILRLNGTIILESEEGKGSKIVVRIPNNTHFSTQNR